MPQSNDRSTQIISVPTGGQRLDVFLTGALAGISRNKAQSLIKSGAALVDGQPAKASYKLEGGETISVYWPEPEPTSIEPESIPLDILYEDDDLAAVNKPAGMVVHPAYGHVSGTLVNAALARWPQMREVGGEERAGVIHRLDKETSGVVLLAKTPAALAALQAQFKGRTVHKTYLALVEGIPDSGDGIIDAPIGRDPRRRKRMAVLRGGRPAVTRYHVLETFHEHTLLELVPQSGRTHQLRVHLAWFGHPVVGDTVYGYRKQRIKLKRHFLHALELRVQSPSSGEELVFQAPLPSGLEDTLAKLRRTRS